MSKARPIENVIEENQSEELTEKLKNFQQAHKFAIEELLLPANDSYTEYADIGRPYAVWNVIAAPAFSVEAKKWCFLFAGCISYRGYFNRQEAEKYATHLSAEGYDVYVAGARAYSTLGWFDDPLLNTMMYENEAARVGILFHELAHQKFYVDDDTTFNEAFATTIEQEGVKRWFERNEKYEKLLAYEKYLKQKNDFNTLLLNYRNKLKKLYKNKSSNKNVLLAKEETFKELKHDYNNLKKSWNGYTGYDKWMEKKLNNAHLALVATYNDLVPTFSRKLNESANIDDFYKFIENLVDKSLDSRKSTLHY